MTDEPMPMPEISSDMKFKISMGLAVTVVGAAIGFGMKLQASIGGIERKFDKLTERLDAFEGIMGDRWTKTQAAEWALRLQLTDPTRSVPDPRDPTKLLKGN